MKDLLPLACFLAFLTLAPPVFRWFSRRATAQRDKGRNLTFTDQGKRPPR